MLCLTWNLRMIVHISPKLRRGLPSTMSCEPMFSRWTLCSRRNCKALSTFSRQWIRILPFVGRGCRRQEHYYIATTTTRTTHTNTHTHTKWHTVTNITTTAHFSLFKTCQCYIIQKQTPLHTVKSCKCWHFFMGTMTRKAVQYFNAWGEHMLASSMFCALN